MTTRKTNATAKAKMPGSLHRAVHDETATASLEMMTFLIERKSLTAGGHPMTSVEC